MLPCLLSYARASRCPSGSSEWRSPFCSLPSQAFVCVLDQQVADREATPLGLGGKPVGQLGRDDNRCDGRSRRSPTLRRASQTSSLLSDPIRGAGSSSGTYRRRTRSLNRPRQLRLGKPGPWASPASTGRWSGGLRPAIDRSTSMRRSSLASARALASRLRASLPSNASNGRSSKPIATTTKS